MTTEEFGVAVRRLMRLEELSHEEFVAAWTWQSSGSIIRCCAGLIPPLKKGQVTRWFWARTPTICMPGISGRSLPKRFSGTSMRLVMSHEVGHVKPTVEFYRACAEAAGRPIEECIFIDDLPENVAGAQAAGMSGILYRDTPTLVMELRDRGVASFLAD